MMTSPEIIEKLGIPMGTLMIVMGGFSWMMRITIKHFITTIEEMNQERKATNKAFLDSIAGFSRSISSNAIALVTLDDHVEEVSHKLDSIYMVANGKRSC